MLPVGNEAAFKLIQQGQDAGLSPSVAALLRSHIKGLGMPSVTNTSESQAIKILSSLMCSTAKLDKSIGTAVDVAKISSRTGFSWLYRNADATKLALQDHDCRNTESRE